MDDEKDSYLIPANSKKSMLILGFFTPIDLIIFLVGIVYSIALLLIADSPSFLLKILSITPALISAFLVLPLPFYHNILQMITNIYMFITRRRRYYWKGWCLNDEKEY